jgi:acetyl esterase/lipase
MTCSMIFAADAKDQGPRPDQVITYKTVTTDKGKFPLSLHVFKPANAAASARACVVMFHGGGWNNGDPKSFFGAGKRWAGLGLVAISVEYRVRDKHGGTALDSVRDAKSAMRWVRSHAKELGIDPDRIAAQGASAGGHLAAACATLTAYDEEGEDATVSCLPNALILKSPVLDNGPDGYGQYKKEVRENWKDFSPFHNVRQGVPPMLVSVGDDEAKYLRVEVAKELKQNVEKLGGRCELIVLPGATHQERTAEQNALVAKAEVDFMRSLGFIKEAD